DALELSVVVEGVHAELAAEAGLLVATEGEAGEGGVWGVDGDDAGLDLTCHAVGTADVAGPQSSCETIHDVVSGLHDLGFGGEAHDGDYGAEYLLLGDAGFVGNAGEHSGEVEIAPVESVAGPLAAGENFGALFAPQFDVAVDALQVFGR